LISLWAAFSQTLQMIKGAVTMLISQIAREGSSSKIKTIKNYLRNSIYDRRLSGLIVLAIERNFGILADSAHPG
jgi:hypothetical protein